MSRTFLEAGFGQWGRKMQTDLSDGIRYLGKSGLADPARVCIVGASYGGYAALAGVTLDPAVYRCAEDQWLSHGETRLQMLQATVAFLRAHNPPD